MDSVLSKRTIRDFRAALKELPHDSSKTYEIMVKRIKSQSADDSEIALKTIAWINLAKSPLLIDEVQHALAVQGDDKTLDPEGIPDDDLILQVCGGLVEPREGGTIGFVHYTIQEYFQRHENRLSDLDIGRTCLTYLNFRDFAKGACFYQSRPPISPQRDGENKYLGHRLDKFRLLPYASDHWGQHVRNAEDPGLMDMALRFCRQRGNAECSFQVLCRPDQRKVDPRAKFPDSERNFENGVYGLWLASYFGLFSVVARLLHDVPLDLWSPQCGRLNPTWAAFKNGHNDIVELLLASGQKVRDVVPGPFGALYGSEPGDPSFRSLPGSVPDDLFLIAYLVRQGDLRLMRFCFEIDQGYKFQDFRGTTTAHLAARFSQPATLSFILSHHPGIHAAKDEKGMTALHFAAERGHAKITSLLLENWAEVDPKDLQGNTPLHVTDSSIVAHILIENEADVNNRNSQNWTPLHMAAGAGNSAKLRVLLNNGSEIEARDTYGRTALIEASRAKSLDCVKLLLERQAQIEAQDNYGYTALYTSDEKVVRELIDRGCNINHRDNNGGTALHRSPVDFSPKTAQMLLDNGADISAVDNSGCTTLMKAAETDDVDNVESAKFLLERSPDLLDRRDHLGKTALYHAIEAYEEDMVNFLLERGANIDIACNENKTPLLRSLEMNFDRSAELIIKRNPAHLERRKSRWDARFQLVVDNLYGSAEHFLSVMGVDKPLQVDSDDCVPSDDRII